MSKNRDKVGIIAAVLEAANSGASKTRIMRTANLSYKLLGKYLEATLQLGFIRCQASRYELTFRGKEFLNSHRQFQDKYLPVKEMLKNLEIERKQLERQCQESAMVLQTKQINRKRSLKNGKQG